MNRTSRYEVEPDSSTDNAISPLPAPNDVAVNYGVELTIDGNRIALSVDGTEILTHAYGSSARLHDGKVGVGSRDSAASFDNLTIDEVASSSDVVSLPGDANRDGVF